MATDERAVRLDLSYDELLAIAWAIWFSLPAAQSRDLEALGSASDKVLAKRRQLTRPGALRAAVEGGSDGEGNPDA